MPDFAGIPIFVNDLLPEDCIMLIGKNTRSPRVEVGSMQTLRDALDAEFLRTSTIIKWVSIG